MTIYEKNNIADMRKKGISYREIARLLGMNVNSVSSYCKRHGLGGRAKVSEKTRISEVLPCQFCGAAVAQTPHRKAKKFCSDTCRMKWWNLHKSCVNRNSEQSFLCPVCGGIFTAYASANRKYCSKKCCGEARKTKHEE